MSLEQQYSNAGYGFTNVVRALSLSVALLVPCVASAVSLGPISVLSNLGEPLQAEIEIFDLQSEEAHDLDVALASESQFSHAGNTRSILMESLKFSVTQQGRRRMITISTDKPLEQPIYGLLLELRANGESKIAEFAVLPEEAVKTAEPVHVTETAAAQETATPASAPTQTTQSSKADQVETVSTEIDPSDIAGKSAENLALADAQSNSRQHAVQRGQNLTVIARQYSVANADLNKFIAATYNDNPDAFIKNNLHYLKAGAVLALPSDESMNMVDDRTARQTITTQWQTFKELVASLDPTGGKATDAQPTRSTSRKISQAKRDSSQAKGDQLTLSALTRSENAGKNKTEEEAIATKKAAEEASERVRLLEKNVHDLKTALQPNPLTVPEGKKADAIDADQKENNFWGILSSPARDLMMQGATVILLAALVLIALIRRNKASS